MFIYTPPKDFDPEKHFEDIPFGQGGFFKRWKEACGHDVVSLAVDADDASTRVYVQCISYVVPVTGVVWIAVGGPVGSFNNIQIEEQFYAELRRLCVAAAPNTSHIRIQRVPTSRYVRTRAAEHTSGVLHHPVAEHVVSLDGDMHDIAEGFAVNTRRLIRRYEHDAGDVRFHIERTDYGKHLQDIYTLLSETASLKGFTLHPFEYYHSLFSELTLNPEYGALVLGYVDDTKKLASAALTIYTGVEAYYLIACSSHEGYQHAMPTLTVYTSMKEAKQQGLRRYNFGSMYVETNRSLRHLRSQSLFKKKFGGETVEYEHPRDLVVSSWRYLVFRLLRWYPVMLLRRLAVRWYAFILVEVRKELN